MHIDPQNCDWDEQEFWKPGGGRWGLDIMLSWQWGTTTPPPSVFPGENHVSVGRGIPTPTTPRKENFFSAPKVSQVDLDSESATSN